MKTKLFCFTAILCLFASCDKIKEAATVSISTQIKSSIPIVVTAPGVKSDAVGLAAPIIFSKTQEIKIEDNVDLAPYIAKIKEVDLNSVTVIVSGLTAGQTINSVSVDIVGIGTLFTKTDITMANNTFTPSISANMLDLVSSKILSDKKITITVSGSTSGPISIIVGLNIDAKVIAYVLK